MPWFPLDEAAERGPLSRATLMRRVASDSIPSTLQEGRRMIWLDEPSPVEIELAILHEKLDALTQDLAAMRAPRIPERTYTPAELVTVPVNMRPGIPLAQVVASLRPPAPTEPRARRVHVMAPEDARALIARLDQLTPGVSDRMRESVIGLPVGWFTKVGARAAPTAASMGSWNRLKAHVAFLGANPLPENGPGKIADPVAIQNPV